MSVEGIDWNSDDDEDEEKQGCTANITGNEYGCFIMVVIVLMIVWMCCSGTGK